MQWIESLPLSNDWLYFYCFLIGLLVGSFLNVVIARLPQMLYHQWEQQCHAYLIEHHHPSPFTPRTCPVHLCFPRSFCPHCKHTLSWMENIPIISFLLQRGRCKICRHPVSWQYPLVELLSGSLAALTAWQFGFSIALLGALIYTWALISLSMIDLKCQILPDDITFPLLWLGLIFNLFETYTSLPDALLGAIGGYLFLWSVYWLFKVCTKKEGMGYGDFKLLALLGAWGGWQMLPLIVLLASCTGAVVGLLLIRAKTLKYSHPLPFGPYLASAGWITFLWGNHIPLAYLPLIAVP